MENLRISNIENKIQIEALIQQSLQLSGSGRYLKAVEHDSLVIDTHTQFWFWNSKFKSGKHIAWVQECFPEMNFHDALTYLENLTGSETVMPSFASKEKAEPKPPENNLVLKYHFNLLESDFAKKAWNKRGINSWHWNKWLLGFKEDHWGQGNALSMPFLDGAEVKTIRHRMLSPNAKSRYLPESKEAGTWLFNADVLDQNPPYIVILEGEIKTMILSGFGEFVIGLSGINHLPPSYLAKICKIPVVYVFPDPLLNSRKAVSPYQLNWIKLLYKQTDVRIMSPLDKIDDFLLEDNDYFKTYKSVKKDARRVTERSMEF